ncbi:hypothetical protein [Cytobacillus praedii]|uniref:Uncharacterized protein n=1 Tax=Cytobacillus praedii TaxID=1742358 RepID=A0A4R1ASF1_9BACI|nr:hypothetical protein [Cytobacillus praedii]TCJ00428.1 hypothetical protein E0Y62_26910 [Cytobacillus praedii]
MNKNKLLNYLKQLVTPIIEKDKSRGFNSEMIEDEFGEIVDPYEAEYILKGLIDKIETGKFD